MQPLQAAAGAVDRSLQPALAAAQMAVLLGNQGHQARPVNRHRQRQAQQQVVARGQQAAQPHLLRNAQAIVFGDHQLGDTGAAHLLAHALERLKEARAFGSGHGDALGHDPVGAGQAQHADEQRHTGKKAKDLQAGEALVDPGQHRPGQQGQTQQQSTPDPQPRQQQHAKDMAAEDRRL